ncbi:prepilin-type N-terminal cleavage/methylation domain-containing protein [Cohnella sp. GCM10020058]|uniref:prepilin-type N-terminal cleavage/methylation domain-containing protein n=1 Tax=Cohnella sp. GCM10020058 TaxID=3317330 RepID=UPI00362FC424
MRTAVMKRLGKAKEDQKGFTLIELLAVIVILAVIAAIAIPLIGSIINKSKKDSDVATARQIYDASRLYITSQMDGDPTGGGNGIVLPIVEGTGDWVGHGLQKEGYLDNNLVLPSTKGKIVGGKVVYKTDGTLAYVFIDSDSGSTAGKDDIYVSGADVLKGEGSATGAAPTTDPTAPATP